MLLVIWLFSLSSLLTFSFIVHKLLVLYIFDSPSWLCCISLIIIIGTSSLKIGRIFITNTQWIFIFVIRKIIFKIRKHFIIGVITDWCVIFILFSVSWSSSISSILSSDRHSCSSLLELGWVEWVEWHNCSVWHQKKRKKKRLIVYFLVAATAVLTNLKKKNSSHIPNPPWFQTLVV